MPTYYRLRATRSALATSPATLNLAREADATMAHDNWAEDAYPVPTPTAIRPLRPAVPAFLFPL
jgi:hypothetical protein